MGQPVRSGTHQGIGETDRLSLLGIQRANYDLKLLEQ